MRIIADHFRLYAHALRFAIGLHGVYKFHRIVENKHYQISSGARASLGMCYDLSLFTHEFNKVKLQYNNAQNIGNWKSIGIIANET